MRVPSRPAALAGPLIVALLLAACSAPAAGSPGAPTSTPAVTPTAPASAITASEAAAIVVALDARFAGISPRDPGMVGQGSWYEAVPAASGWSVTVQLGWGDCPAGCISRHTWVYVVTSDGVASKVSETGDALPVASGPIASAQPVPSALAQASPTPTRHPTPRPTPVPTARATSTPSVGIPTSGGPWIVGMATAAPTCPVESNPPLPGCAPRPVGGATIIVRDAGGRQIASTTTGSDGSYRVAVPAGSVRVEAAPAAGVMHAPAPIDVVVPAGAAAWVRVDLSYDTGIR
jgi:hypothetical protein